MKEKNKIKKSENSSKVTGVVDAYITSAMDSADPQGWYTGKPENKYEKPVQDADDL